jgi:hypothetical protein
MIPYWEATLSVEHDFGKRADEVVEMITTLARFSATIAAQALSNQSRSGSKSLVRARHSAAKAALWK